MAPLKHPSVPGLGGYDLQQDRSDTGDFLRRLRVNWGLAPERFAKLLRVRQRTVLRWETGQLTRGRVDRRIVALLTASD